MHIITAVCACMHATVQCYVCLSQSECFFEIGYQACLCPILLEQATAANTQHCP